MHSADAPVSPPFTLDLAVAGLAGTQRGVCSRKQLVELGLSEDQIRHRLARGSLHRVGPSVYAVGHPGISRSGRGMAALLHTGPTAALSHETGARICEMVSPSTDGPIHVSVPGRPQLVAPAGVVIHRPRVLAPADIEVRRGLRVTTPERIVIDLLPRHSVSEITRMLEQMVTVLDRSPDALHSWGTALPATPGKRKLLRALDEIAGPAVIRSEFERLFRSLCQDAGIPQALTNYRIGKWEVDAVFPDQHVAIELDSYRWHGGRWQFHRDRRKGLAISRAGFELIRLSWPQLKHERAEVAEAIQYALARGVHRLR